MRSQLIWRIGAIVGVILSIIDKDLVFCFIPTFAWLSLSEVEDITGSAIRQAINVRTLVQDNPGASELGSMKPISLIFT